MCMLLISLLSRIIITEAAYAYKLKKKIIPLRLEQGYTPDGWLGLLQGMDLYYACYSDDVLDKSMPALLKVIRESTSDLPAEAKDAVDGKFRTTFGNVIKYFLKHRIKKAAAITGRVIVQM